MTNKNIYDSFDKFLEHDSQKVILLKGGWGVGKTYSWNKYVNDCSYTNEHSYSYVSLFGMTSIKKIKHHLILNSKKLKEKNNIEKTSDVLKNISNFVDKIPIVGEKKGTLIEELYLNFGGLNDMLICLDDIERRDISLLNTLGLVESLKNDFNCKVVLIMNEKQLGEADSSVLNMYREKVIDVELKISTSIHELIPIYFKSTEEIEMVSGFVDTVFLTNIRIIQKISWYIQYFKELLSNYNENLKMEVFEHVLILSYIYLSSDSGTTLDKIMSSHSYNFANEVNKEDEASQKAIKLHYFKKRYDKYICSYITNNIIDETSFIEEISILSELYTKSDISKDIKDVWKKIYSNFSHCESDIINYFKNALSNNLEYIDYYEIIRIEQLINSLEGTKTSQWTDKYIKKNIKDKNITILDRIYEDISSDGLKHKVLEFLVKSKEKLTLDFYLSKIILNNRITQKDVDYLLTFEKNMYYSWINGNKDERHIDNICQLLHLFNSYETINCINNVKIKFHSVLSDISQESKLNELRVSKYIGAEYILSPNTNTLN